VDKNGIPWRVTPREYARLQGFLDSFALHPDDSRAYHQLGNSVAVPIVSAIFSDIIHCDPDFYAMLEKHGQSGCKATPQQAMLYANSNHRIANCLPE
jgi:hypothetical protein